MLGADVVPIDRSLWQPAAAVLADAFGTDPVFSWLIPDATSRAERLRRYFAIEARYIVLGHGCSVGTQDGTGIALVLPPRHWRAPVRVQVAHGPQFIQVFGRYLPRALRVLNGMERRHRALCGTGAHYYLPYIGVAASAQGEGVGTRMLAPLLERCDGEGLPAYLEASNPRCARLYRRLGFRTIETIRPGGSPPLELMRYDA